MFKNRGLVIFVFCLIANFLLFVFFFSHLTIQRSDTLATAPSPTAVEESAAYPDFGGASLGGERILSFDSRIEVFPDSFMKVTETLDVLAEGQDIRRGIYRDFPTRYTDRWGNHYEVGFRVNQILRDGRPEPYHLASRPNGQRVYIGQEDVFLDPGVYKYTIVYTTSRQLGFFENHDELYWNVTGNGWSFPIDRARATVILPDSAGQEITFQTAFTGVQGDDGQDYQPGFDDSGNPVFATTMGLNPGEGLTIAVGWPKGYVTELSRSDKLMLFFLDNPGFPKLFLGLVFIVLYYVSVWLYFGRDPRKGTIIPRFHPPEELSPAQARFLRRMRFDNKTVAAALVNLAVQGAVEIHQIEDKKFFGLGGGRHYELRKRRPPQNADTEEAVLITPLFVNGPFVELQQKNYRLLQIAINAMRKFLRDTVENTYFFSNSPLSLGGFALIFGFVFWGLGLSLEKGEVGFLPFVIMVGMLFATGAVFQFLLKAPTLRGRRLLDHLEGFRLFLSVSEQERMNYANPPEKTPQLFEKYLPYALALDVEQQWAEQFSQVLATAGESAGKGYHPRWFEFAGNTSFSGSAFAAGLGSDMVGAIAAASASPGSSSGGGGGGSSGGGGGGGGGGGW